MTAVQPASDARRPSFFSKVRSRFSRRASSRPPPSSTMPPSHAAADADAGPHDPYGKTRGGGGGGGAKPFASQPALGLRSHARAPSSDASDRTSPPRSALPTFHHGRGAGGSFDFGLSRGGGADDDGACAPIEGLPPTTSLASTFFTPPPTTTSPTTTTTPGSRLSPKQVRRLSGQSHVSAVAAASPLRPEHARMPSAPLVPPSLPALDLGTPVDELGADPFGAPPAAPPARHATPPPPATPRSPVAKAPPSPLRASTPASPAKATTTTMPTTPQKARTPAPSSPLRSTGAAGAQKALPASPTSPTRPPRESPPRALAAAQRPVAATPEPQSISPKPEAKSASPKRDSLTKSTKRDSTISPARDATPKPGTPVLPPSLSRPAAPPGAGADAVRVPPILTAGAHARASTEPAGLFTPMSGATDPGAFFTPLASPLRESPTGLTHPHTFAAAAPGPHSEISEVPVYAPAPPRLGTLPAARAGSRLTLAALTGGARLSPALALRQPSLPLLTLPPLPALPPPTPAEPGGPGTRPSAHARLRSMPTLARLRTGTGAPADDGVAEDIADHENAMLEEDEDEDDPAGRGHPADEDDDASADGFVSARSSMLVDAPPLATPRPIPATPGRIDFSSLRRGRVLSNLGNATPKIIDYFSARGGGAGTSPTKAAPAPAGDGLRTPRQADVALPPGPGTPAPADVLARAGVPSTPAPADMLARPGIASRASRSMVDLLSSAAEPPFADAPAYLPPVAGSSALPAAPARTPGPAAPSALRRQHSLPTFTAGSPPPPYPLFGPRSAVGFAVIVPREEEGREELPAYASGVYLRALMPRKLEFSAPGVQARDRKWRRVLCELDGTVFRVYRPPHAARPVGRVAEWWESKVGVGDVAVDATAATAAPGAQTRPSAPGANGAAAGEPNAPANGAPAERPAKADSEPLAAPAAAVVVNGRPAPPAEPVAVPPPHTETVRINSKAGSRFSRMLGGGGGGEHARQRSRASLDVPRGPGSRSSVSLARPSLGGGGGGAPGSPARPSMDSRTSSGSTAGASAPPDPFEDVPVPDARDLLATYTLQHAESGLGSDYAKRKNVIRVRMEGEQFLLQAVDVASVVDWIEGLQAAQNVALDLDERVMPRGPLFPRRRRRRPRRTEEAGAGATTASGSAANGSARPTTANAERR